MRVRHRKSMCVLSATGGEEMTWIWAGLTSLDVLDVLENRETAEREIDNVGKDSTKGMDFEALMERIVLMDTLC